MKKILFMFLLILFSLSIISCEPSTTDVSMNTNITQITTDIPLTHINLVADKYEVCQTAIIVLTPEFTPTNASNQNFTISMPTNVMLSFISGTNNTQLEVVGNPPGGKEIETIIITIVSAINPGLNNTLQIYVYSDLFSPPQCELN